MKAAKSLIVITWDGVSKPLEYVLQDVERNFDLLIFDHSAKASKEVVAHLKPEFYVSTRTENKGQVFNEVYKYLYPNNEERYEYIGVIDDDIYTSYSDLNKLLFIGQINHLDVFQPSITQDSYHDHQRFIHKSGIQIHETSWVEIMCPLYKEAIFKAIQPYCKLTVSGQGIDVYLIPCLQKILGLPKTAVVHAIQIKHCRPIQSGNKIYSNGKNNLEEIESVRQACLALVAETKQGVFTPEFIKTTLEINHFTRNNFQEKWNRFKTLLKNLHLDLIKSSYR
jgi:hypothetical protein